MKKKIFLLTIHILQYITYLIKEMENFQCLIEHKNDFSLSKIEK